MRFERLFLVFGAVVVVGSILIGGSIVLGWGAGDDTPAPAAAEATAQVTEEVTEAPSESPSPRPSPSPSKKPTPKPTPSKKKIVVIKPPPAPKPQPLPSGVKCPFHEGTDAPKAEVESALVAAAEHRFWTSSDVALPPTLIKAVAMQESGWQSTIIACDGGIGTMQVMPNTATWMNDRFDTDFKVHTLDGNTMIGSAYLQWSIKYFGDAYFGGTYVIDAEDCASNDPSIPDYKTPCLLNAVIASYNYGYGKVDVNDHIVIPNPQYVSNVRALMKNY